MRAGQCTQARLQVMWIVFDAAGRPVVAIRGLAFSPMDKASEPVSELLYEIKWEKLDTADNHVKTAAGHWVLIADGSGMAGELGRALELRGASIEVVQPAEILHGDIARDDAVQGVVWLTPLDFDSHSTLAEIQQLLADGAALVSKLTDSTDAFALTQICMVTRGTQTMTGEPVTNVLGAGAWGLFGSVANEYSSLRTLCADLPSVPVENEMVRLADLLLEDRKEGQIALRAEGNFGARLRSFETDAGNFQKIPSRTTSFYRTRRIRGFRACSSYYRFTRQLRVGCGMEQASKGRRGRDRRSGSRNQLQGCPGCDGSPRGSEGITNRW